MKACNRLSLLVAGVLVLGVTATSAYAALPDLHVVLGESPPVAAVAQSATANWSFDTAGGTVFSGTGVEATLTWTALSALGTYVLKLSNAKKGIRKCKTAGDIAGTVLLAGEVHLVFVLLSPLTAALLFLIPKTKVECEGFNVTVEGSFLGSYNGAINAEITEFKSDILGSKGKEEKLKYLNEAGTTELEALLLSEAGAGFTKTSFDIDQELTFKTNKMIEVLG